MTQEEEQRIIGRMVLERKSLIEKKDALWTEISKAHHRLGDLVIKLGQVGQELRELQKRLKQAGID